MPSLTVTRMSQRAMGVTCDITVVGGDGISVLRDSLAAVSRLESLWSRFVPDSDISRLNRSNGAPTWVSTETIELVRTMIAGHEATGGMFDPTLLPAQLRAGDRRSLVDGGLDETPVPVLVSHDIHATEIIDDCVIRIPQGMLLDAGGIGKGLAADMVASAAMQAGAAGVCINIGGDMRCLGETPDPRGWTVMVGAPDDYERTVGGVCISNGAVATSAVGARARAGAGTGAHIQRPDRLVGSPQRFTGASVVAGSGAWAEMFTKWVLLGEPDETFARLDSMEIACLAVGTDGSVTTNTSWARYAL